MHVRNACQHSACHFLQAACGTPDCARDSGCHGKRIEEGCLGRISLFQRYDRSGHAGAKEPHGSFDQLGWALGKSQHWAWTVLESEGMMEAAAAALPGFDTAIALQVRAKLDAKVDHLVNYGKSCSSETWPNGRALVHIDIELMQCWS